MRPRRTNLQLRLWGRAALPQHGGGNGGGGGGGDGDGDGFLEFLSALLARDPAERPTAAQALRHPWLAAAPPLPVEPYVLPAAAALD